MDLQSLGWMNTDYKTPNDNIFPLLDAVIHFIPSPNSFRKEILNY